MNVLETVTHPWREPVDYAKLLIAFLAFSFFAYLMLDTMRIVASWPQKIVS